MLLMLIDDINKALDNNCFFSALSLALTIPDICGKAEYPNDNTTARYKKWYSEYVGKYEINPEQNDKDMPYLSADIVYNLRNNFLHQGAPKTEKVDEFKLIVEDKKEFNSLIDMGCVHRDSNGICITEYSVNVRRLCFIICANAKAYYNENKNKFNFFNCTIIKYDENASTPFNIIYNQKTFEI